MRSRVTRFIHQKAREFRVTIPTSLTLMRIACIPVIVFFIYFQHMSWALMLFSFAAATDVLDGYLARRWGEQTFLGACLDPIADKLLVATLFLTLWFLSHPFLPGWFVVFVFAKEAIQIVGSLLVFLRQGTLFICPALLGKLSMFVQTCFIFVLLLGYLVPVAPVIFSGLLSVSTFLLGASLVQYVALGVRQSSV
ncbi:CDP-alcohol phosphatidyltransferase family protein [Methylicorpusculum sp.]|uniref:CDP-alcohol phosphatidyltransferase family protein n=1 Tax=Methylicorpusculum sp. TaxID=2713644 RepID=UPI002AB9DF48|nr:CDP-alcohol phosphatidyltransferase family protein [Methylicorpusculum sp.]MDZ4151177.1 CDP-alcohol phosphatidyltransferase family protein [Methylicorpusculum sp.]